MAQLDLLSDVVQNSLPSYKPLSEMRIPDAPLLPKANGAYKTIREVSEELNVPQHVLRFWESNFPQVKPSRMRGSRRYYRPEDVDCLKTIQTLLYTKGYTIKGAKKILREGKAAIAGAPSTRPVASATAQGATAATDKKQIDKKSLVSELRVLKSMLTSLL